MLFLRRSAFLRRHPFHLAVPVSGSEPHLALRGDSLGALRFERAPVDVWTRQHPRYLRIGTVHSGLTTSNAPALDFRFSAVPGAPDIAVHRLSPRGSRTDSLPSRFPQPRDCGLLWSADDPENCLDFSAPPGLTLPGAANYLGSLAPCDELVQASFLLSQADLDPCGS